MSKRITSLGSVVSCVLAAFSVQSAHAEVLFGLRAGATYSDNVERVPVDEQSSSAAAVGLDLRAERDTGRLLYDVFADLEYWDYFEDDVESQEYGQFIADSSYAFVPETFDWLLSGSFSQVREDLLRPAAPGNLEEVITAATGPRWRLRFGDAVEAITEAHYSIAEYSEREFDSETLGGSLVLGRRLSAQTLVGVGGRFDDVSYRSDAGVTAPDFERREYFLTYNTEGVRTTFAAEVGYAEVEGATLEDDGPMARIRATRQLTPFVSGFIGYVREFPTSEGAAFTSDNPVPGDDSSVLTGAPRQAESAEVGLEMVRPRTTGRVSFTRRQESELTSTVSRDFDEISASLTRLLTTRSSAAIFGMYTEETIDGLLSESEETTIGAEINIALGRTLSLDLRVEHRERDASVPEGEYSELSGGIFLRYGSARRFVPQ